MSPSVAGKWSRKGFTAATAIIPKAQRDASLATETSTSRRNTYSGANASASGQLFGARAALNTATSAHSPRGFYESASLAWDR